jgi:hypothetical protein
MKWLSIILIFTFLVSDQEKNYIIQDEDVVFEPPMTGKKSREILMVAKERRFEKTMGKYVPKVYITNLKGDTLELSALINNYSLISSADFHCGWGSGYIQDIFPEVYECNYYNNSLDAFMLIRINDSEYIKSQKAINDMEWHLYWYRNKDLVYFISNQESKKMNLFSSPSHLITDPEGKVVFYNTGAHLPDFWLPVIDSITGFERL